MRNSVIQLIEKLPPKQRTPVRQRLLRLYRPAWLGTIRRTTPLSVHYGYDRGNPVDRYYIEQFLDDHRADICGHVLEVKDSTYTDRYGQEVEQRSVLDINPKNARANIIADLSAADAVPSNAFDCFILTQTLQMIFNLHEAIRHAHRILRPGGVLLVTVPSVSRVLPQEGIKSDYWRFTAASCQALFSGVFTPEQVTVTSYGNVLSAVAFLMGMGSEELSQSELDVRDDYFPVVLAVRAVKQ